MNNSDNYPERLRKAMQYVMPDTMDGRVYNFEDTFYPLPLKINDPDDPLSEFSVTEKPDLSHKLTLITGLAGAGKTTLLKRIAYMYAVGLCRDISEDSDFKNFDLKEYYGLPDAHFPVLIRLREIERYEHSISKAVKAITGMEADELPEDALYLADGLDEVDEDYLVQVVRELVHLAGKSKSARVILSSRPVGVCMPDVSTELSESGFNRLGIEAYALKDALEYGRHRFALISENDKGNEAAREKCYKGIITTGIFRRPIELECAILKAVNAEGALSIYHDKYELYEDIITSMLSSRSTFAGQDIAVNEALAVLSYVAAYMQKNGSLFITAKELSEIEEKMKETGRRISDFRGGAVLADLLEDIAVNTGIVDAELRKGDGVRMYTFPLRTYQEFLAAFYYAEESKQRWEKTIAPSPSWVLRENAASGRWLNVILFMLQRLARTHLPEYKAALRVVFEEIKDTYMLGEIIKESLPITKSEAKILCKRYFKTLTIYDQDFFALCMGSEASEAFISAIEELYYENNKDVSGDKQIFHRGGGMTLARFTVPTFLLMHWH